MLHLKGKKYLFKKVKARCDLFTIDTYQKKVIKDLMSNNLGKVFISTNDKKTYVHFNLILISRQKCMEYW